MHELALALELFKIVEQEARVNNLKKVTKVKVKVGEAAGIEFEFLRHSFLEHIFTGTIADGSDLEIISEKIAATCKDCNLKVNKPVVKCPSCGSSRLEVTGGKDVYLDSIEGEK